MATGFDTPINTNDQSLDRVLATGIPTLLVFLDGRPPADLDAVLSQLARQHQGDLLVALVQSKDNPAATQKYRIDRLPAVVAVRSGQPVSQAQGVASRAVGEHAAYLLGHGPKPVIQGSTSTPSSGYASGYTQSTDSDLHQNGQGQPAPDRPIPVNEATFDREVFRSNGPVLVDFWAPWCGPCRMTDPILEKLARELGSRLKIAKVNVDENPGISQRYNIRSIPTMMMVKNGKIVDQWAGALPEPALRSRINPHISR